MREALPAKNLSALERREARGAEVEALCAMSAKGKTVLDFLDKLLERACSGTDNCDQIMLTVRLIVKATLLA